MTSPLLTRLQTLLQGRYEPERELGRGGMATVFLAQDVRHRRQVAVKVLSPELAAMLGSDRFLREIEIAANLHHPHILPLYDSGEVDGILFYVMPYVEGESLRDRINREQQLSLEDALQITREIADALGYAHGRGIIHRDIKPENIMLQSGHAQVADFGIARAISAAGDQKITQTGLAIGTPAYMSPEQASGDPRVDGRADIYALACVLYEMLGGEPPFQGPTAQAILARHTLDPVPPVRTVRPSVPPGVEGAINRALAKAPADRFPTASGFAAALSGAPMAPVVSLPPTSRRRSPMFWLGVGSGLATVAIALTIAANRRGRHLPEPASMRALPAASMVRVPGGPYRLFGGNCQFCLAARTVTLDSFEVDRTEVTVSAYAKYVESGAVPPPWTTRPGDSLPVTGVMWGEAREYCAHLGSRLPTEAEWEAAARGSDAREYPWGKSWEPGRANAANAWGRVVQVGSHPSGASPSGALDMAGNVWEWTQTRGQGSEKGTSLYVIRGGAFDSPPERVTTFYRVAYPPLVTEGQRQEYFGKTGFRCAR